ncbi:MAG: signal peptidase I [Pirellula sp.]|nr:signal peptidase I [Pirellula sp.]
MSSTTNTAATAQPQPIATDAAASTVAKTSGELVVRETVESLAVAFILALLFKAFVAEAFVIPTGSMAPTLMGAHKDILGEDTGYQFQVGASSEFDNDLGKKNATFVIGAICPISRKPQVISPLRDKNESTFSGDRILVSKLAYVWNIPKRWDVIVFKFIEKARQNYIKRCIGLPNETIRVFGGDIYIRPSANSPFEIARKPPHVLAAMMQLVNDTDYAPKSLIKANVPAPWQSLEQDSDAWKSDWSSGVWTAQGEQKSDDTAWLRYFHRVIDIPAWQTLEKTGALPVSLGPRQPRLITDFTAYNAFVDSDQDPGNYTKEPEKWLERAAAEMAIKYRENSLLSNDGMHWTGDLGMEVDFETSSGTKSVSLMIIESGLQHIVTIDLVSGNATAEVKRDDQQLAIIENGSNGSKTATASTSVRAGKKHRIKFSNIDEQLTMWVDGRLVSWSPSNKLSVSALLKPAERGPTASSTDPLDGAPLGIGVAGGSMSVTRAKVFRDIYHIAYGPSSGRGLISDYRVGGPQGYAQIIRDSVTDAMRDNYARNMHGISANELRRKMPSDVLDRFALASDPAAWGKSEMISKRSTYEFQMMEDWFFPMGDNSAASYDARSWRDHHTPQRLMIGRAVVVFWPHFWNAPIPFFPNFQRMGLIR